MPANATVHKIGRYSVQVHDKALKEGPRGSIIVRLYDEAGHSIGIAVFKDYGDEQGELPFGDHKAGTATAFYDISFYPAFIDILRIEKELYWKIAWVQTGAAKSVSDVSLDTKKEIIGEYFSRN